MDACLLWDGRADTTAGSWGFSLKGFLETAGKAGTPLSTLGSSDQALKVPVGHLCKCTESWSQRWRCREANHKRPPGGPAGHSRGAGLVSVSWSIVYCTIVKPWPCTVSDVALVLHTCTSILFPPIGIHRPGQETPGCTRNQSSGHVPIGGPNKLQRRSPSNHPRATALELLLELGAGRSHSSLLSIQV